MQRLAKPYNLHGLSGFDSHTFLHGSVVQWSEHRPVTPEVAGSSPVRVARGNMYLELGKASNLAMYCTQVAYVSKSWTEMIGWEATQVPLVQVLNEPVLKEIHSEFPIAKAAILRMEPYQAYHWHVDAQRGVSINMLLSAHDTSHCLFGSPKNDDNMYFTELKYKPNTLYLFDTQTLHTIINFETPRYLFSVEFEDSVDKLVYNDIYEWKRGRVVEGSSLEN